jgi:hypothetical protein
MSRQAKRMEVECLDGVEEAWRSPNHPRALALLCRGNRKSTGGGVVCHPGPVDAWRKHRKGTMPGSHGACFQLEEICQGGAYQHPPRFRQAS